MEALESRNLLATIEHIVTNDTDTGNENIQSSLSGAIKAANDDPGNSHVIKFAMNKVGVGATLTLTLLPPASDTANQVELITAPNVKIDGIDTRFSIAEERRVRIVRGNDFVQRGLMYDGDSSTSWAVNTTHAHFEVDSVRVEGIPDGGVAIKSLSSGDEVTVKNSKFNLGGGHGIVFDEVPFGLTGKFTIDNNVIFSRGGGGIVMRPASSPIPSQIGGSVITNNTIGWGVPTLRLSNSGSAIQLGNGISSVTVSHNKIYADSDAGIRILGNANNITITDNDIYTDGLFNPGSPDGDVGVWIFNTDTPFNRKITIDDNTFISERTTRANNPGVALEPNAGTGVRITGNEFRNAGELPIDLGKDFTPNVNDFPTDGDTGPNNKLNSPSVNESRSTLIGAGPELWWRFIVDVAVDAPGVYRVDAFANTPGPGYWDYLGPGEGVRASSTTGIITNAFDDATNLTVTNEQSQHVARFVVYVLASKLTGSQRLGLTLTGITGANAGNTSEMSIAVITNHTKLNGDFNVDGVVDGADYLLWQQTLGSNSVLHGGGADGNNDGIINGADYQVWADNFGATLTSPAPVNAAQLARTAGDYNGDGVVDQADYNIWVATIGSTTDLRADGNVNGIVDASDLSIWQDLRGVTVFNNILGDFDGSGIVDSTDYAIWAAGNDMRADADGDGVLNDSGDYAIWYANFGRVRADLFPVIVNGSSGMPLEVPGAAPSAIDFTIRNSSGTSFSLGSVTGSGEQLRTVPVSSPNKISIKFSEEVFVLNPALVLTNLDGSTPSLASFAYDVPTQTATWTFASALADGRYLVRLADTVFDLDREALDGEFVNPWALSAIGSDSLPSGDGAGGGEFRFRFTILAGDADRNNIHGTTNFQNWKSTEPGMVYVSTTADDYDGDLSFGDVSLREAVNYANGAGIATTVVLPTGRYTLSRTGNESTPTVAYNELNVDGNVTIVGDGPGFTIIDNSGLTTAPANNRRTFLVNGTTAALALTKLTVANGSSTSISSLVAIVTGGATMALDETAIVNHTALAGGTAIHVGSSTITINRSVFTNNDNTGTYGGAAVQVSGTTTAPASITVGESIFAFNYQPGWAGPAYDTKNPILISSGAGTVTKVNKGKNLYDFAGGGFFNTTPGVGDRLGMPTYIVTSVADTFNHSDDLEAVSLREAVDLANAATSGTPEIWVPAWQFTLARDRGANTTDTDVSYGDLDVKKSMVVRGVADRTRISWKASVVDEVFDLLGDLDNDWTTGSGDVDGADYMKWQQQLGSTGGYELFSADADDDGDVDSNDYTIWSQNYGHTLQWFDIKI